MDITIATNKENPLLKRREVQGTISFTGPTPTYPQLQQALAAQLKTKEDVIAIKNIYTQFGAPKATFFANVYETAEQLKKVEPKVKPKKDKNAAEEKK